MILAPLQYMGDTIRRIDLDGLSLTLTVYPVHQHQPWHEHENATFFLLMQGAFRDSTREYGERTLDRLSVVYHPPEMAHSCEAGPDGRAGLNIEPSTQWLAKYGLATSDFGEYRIDERPHSILWALKLLLNASGNFADFCEPIQDQVFELLTGYVRPSSDEKLTESPAWFGRVERLLWSVPAQNLSLNQVANAVAVHPVYLARVFRERYGCSLGEYVLRRRLCAAAETVLREGVSLGQAAYDSAFADQAHFSRMFRRELGISPRSLLQLRKELLQ